MSDFTELVTVYNFIGKVTEYFQGHETMTDKQWLDRIDELMALLDRKEEAA